MSDIPNRPGEELPEPVLEKPRHRLSEFMGGWLKRRLQPFSPEFEAPEEADEDEEDGEETTKKPERKGFWQRFRGRFRPLFGGHIARPEFLPVDTKKPEVDVEAATIQEEATDKNEKDLGRLGEPVASLEKLPVASVNLEGEIYNKPREGSAEDLVTEPEPILINITPTQQRAAEQMMAPFQTESIATLSSTPVIERERVVERSQGTAVAAALVGLEYVGRRRAVGKTRKEVRTLAQEQRKTRETVRRLEQQALSAKQELQTIKRQEKAFEKTIKLHADKKIPKVETKSLELPGREETAKSSKELVEAMPMAEQVVQHVDKLEKADARLERVEVAAEQDIPIEAIYERRHEVKDQSLEGPGSFGAPSTSHEPILLADALRQREQLARQQFHRQKSLSDELATGSKSLYKTAVTNGFLAALVLLVFIAVVFLTSH